MRTILTVILLVATMLSAAALADTVYMRDGRKLVGKVIEEGDTVRIQMAYGTVDLKRSEIIYIVRGTGTTQPTATTDPTPQAVTRFVPARPDVVWTIEKAVLPEAILFMVSRRLELLADDPSSLALREQVRRWRISAHDGQRKLGHQWLSRTEQRRRRGEYEKRQRLAYEHARKARSLSRSQDPQKVRQYKEYTVRAAREMETGIRNWPDSLMQMFFLAVLDLERKDYKQAEIRFRKCIEAEPLVAAFRQGRGMALLGLSRPLTALAEFVGCMQLRDDTYQTRYLVEETMKAVPGVKLKDPVYLMARDLLDRYEEPRSAYRPSSSRGTAWLMPSRRPWMSQGLVLFLPTYDRIVTRQALGVPVAAGALLVDKAALKGAELVYVQLSDNVIVRAYPKKTIYGFSSKKADLPVTLLLVPTATFTPVDLIAPAKLKAGDDVTVRAANALRQMGTTIRADRTKVVSVEDGTPVLKTGSLPGERVAAVFLDDVFAGLVTGRAVLQEDDCGTSTFIKPADLAALGKQLKRSSFGSYSAYSGPRLKADAPKIPASGSVFRVFALVGDRPPPPIGK